MTEEMEGISKHHNYYRIGVFDAVARVQEDIDSKGLELVAGFLLRGEELPEKGKVVGSVKVHSSDVSYTLYVVPFP